MDLRKLLSPGWLEEINFLESWNLILDWNTQIYIEMGAVFRSTNYDAFIFK